MRPKKNILLFAMREPDVAAMLLPLRVRGWRVEVASTVDEAKAALDARTCDLVVAWDPAHEEYAAAEALAHARQAPVMLVRPKPRRQDERAHCGLMLIAPTMQELIEGILMAMRRQRGPRCVPLPLGAEPVAVGGEESFRGLEIYGEVFIPGVRQQTMKNKIRHHAKKGMKKFSTVSAQLEGVRGLKVTRVA